MVARKLLIAALLLATAGCGKAAEGRNLELEQQKLNLETAGSQREQLAALLEREKACATLEKKNAAALSDVERERSESLGLSKELAEREKGP